MVVGRRSSPIWDWVTFQGQIVKLWEGIPSSLFPNVFKAKAGVGFKAFTTNDACPTVGNFVGMISPWKLFND